MAVGDISVFSQVDDALWAVIQDTTVPDGTDLQAWRAEQSSAGSHPGVDFDEGEVPDPDDLRATDFPAVIIRDGDPTLNARLQPGLHEIVYRRTILGFLQAEQRETLIGKKVKKFSELVWNVIAHFHVTNFGSKVVGTNPIERVVFGPLTFSDLTVEDGIVFGFSLDLDFFVRMQST